MVFRSIPKYSAEKGELKSFVYSLSNKKLLLYRGADTGFFNKWCGVWMHSLKVYEYFAFRLNGEWLSPANIKRFIHAPWFVAHKYELKDEINMDLEATELVFMPDDLPAVVVLLKLENSSTEEKQISFEAEVAVNIRRKSEEFNLRKYESSFEDLRKCVLVKSEDEIFVCFGSDFKEDSLEIRAEMINHYREHYPAGELQRCFLPSIYRIELVLAPGEIYYLPFVFSSGYSKKECLDTFDNGISGWQSLLRSRVENKLKLMEEHYFVCDSKAIEELFTASVLNLDDFICWLDGGVYLRAGYPWFLEAWSRDDLWSCLGMISLGWFDVTAKTMKFFTRFRMHRLPCKVEIDRKRITTSYHGAGVDPLYLIVLDYLRGMSGRKFKELGKPEKEILKHLVLENYLVVHGPKETWMDSIERKGTAVEIQGMWVKAMERRDPELSRKLRKIFKNKFWNRELAYPFDSYSSLPSGRITPNCFVPAMLGLYNKRELEAIVERTEKELECDCGIRTLSFMDKDYDPSGYHTGSAWGLTTAWGAALYLTAGKQDAAISLLEKLARDLHREHVGFVAEAWDSGNKRRIGATAQLWSTSLIPYLIDEYLLGIRWDEENKRLLVAPRMPSGWRKIKRGIKKVRSATLKLEMSRLANGYELVLEFLEMPAFQCRVVMPTGVKNLYINGRKTEGRAATFVPKKKNVVRAVFRS